MAETSSLDTPPNPQSSIDTPSIDAYVSSLIASGAVEEGAFYKWTTPSGEVYYGPNPRRARTVTPRTQRTPIDPMPEIKEPDISEVQQIAQRSLAEEDSAQYGGREGEAPPNEPFGYFTGPGGSFQMREGVTPAEIALALQNNGITRDLLDKLDINLAEVLGLEPNSFLDTVSSVLSFLTKGITGNLFESIAGISQKDLMASIGELSNLQGGAEMVAQALANAHAQVGLEGMGSIIDGLTDAIDAARAEVDREGITVAEQVKARGKLEGLERAMKSIHSEMSGRGPEPQLTADDLGFNSTDADMAMNDPDTDVYVDPDTGLAVALGNSKIDGAVTVLSGGWLSAVGKPSFPINSKEGQAALAKTAAAQKGNTLQKRSDLEEMDDSRLATTTYDPKVGIYDPGVDEPGNPGGRRPGQPTASVKQRSTERPFGPLVTKDEYGKWDFFTIGGRDLGDLPTKLGGLDEDQSIDPGMDTNEALNLGGIEEYDLTPGAFGHDAASSFDAASAEGAAVSSWYHEGGLINKNNAWMGGEDSTDHDYQPLTDARPMFDEGGMVKKPSYQAGGKVKPQQSPYAAFQNRANQQTRQMMQPKQQPGQRPQPMAGQSRTPAAKGAQPRQPSAKGAPQAGSDVDITAKKGEFVIPVDVVKIKGTEFFEKAISGARKTHFEATGRRNAQKQKRVSKNVSRFDPNAPKSRRNPFGLPKIAGATPSPGTPPVKPKVKRPVPGARPTSPVTQQPTNRGSQQLRQPILS